MRLPSWVAQNYIVRGDIAGTMCNRIYAIGDIHNHHNIDINRYQSTAVWRWIGSLRIFCLCVYSFVICCAPLGVLRPPIPLLVSTLGSFWVPWAALGPFGAPWVAMDVALLCLGRYSRFLTKLDVQFRATVLKSAACAQKLTSRNSSVDPGNPANPGKVAQGPQLPTPLHSRRGPG